TPRFLDISRHFTVHLFRPWMPRSTRCQHFLRSAERRGLETTAVNIFEGRRNLLWVKDLKQLITYCKSNMSSMKIIGYIVNANLIVILGDMDKDRATPNRPDNPLSKCRHASNDLHGSGLPVPDLRRLTWRPPVGRTVGLATLGERSKSQRKLPGSEGGQGQLCSMPVHVPRALQGKSGVVDISEID